MDAEIKPTKHSAPGQYLGFALQPVRAFFHLLTAPKGAKVALELQDDVSVHYADGSVCLEQTKSALKQNPIADWDEDLWKTFDNWRVMLDTDQCKADSTRFRLYVTPAKKGAFAEALAAAKSGAEIEAQLSAIETKLEKKKKPPTCAAKVKALLDAREDHRHGLIRNFELEADADDPLESIRDLLRPTVAEGHIDIIVRSGIGQVKQAIDRLIQRGEKPILDAEAFRRDFHAFIRQNNLPGLLVSLSASLDDTLVSGMAAARPVFVRQLEFIEVAEEERLRAVSDYLRTSADKADWAERGEIFSGSLDSWDNDLIKKHGMAKGDVSDLHSEKSPVVQGRLIYRQCAQHSAPLEGRVVPSHFVHGCFNDLADRCRLGWHGDYLTLLEDGSE
ncbi:hypothetical protein P7L79_05200 (plasmid) [Tistrella mobilis]|uniref:ABC-three component system protein n=1 Tax=Tistrella mobilis TaxID=171437 RepID=UPI0035561D7E